MFGAILNWFPSQEDYAALTLYELDEMRSVCKEINKGR